jgi:hypothetical protein
LTSKTDRSINLRENRIVISHANIKAWVKLSAALTDNDRSGLGKLAAIELNAAILRVAVSSVPSRTTCLILFLQQEPVIVSI